MLLETNASLWVAQHLPIIGWPTIVGLAVKFLYNHASHWEEELVATKNNTAVSLQKLDQIAAANAEHSKAIVAAIEKQTDKLEDGFRELRTISR